MKKDIEWLREEVWKQDTVMDKGYIYTDDLMSIINEVDEPEVKQLERKIEELESYNDELIRDNNQFRNELDNQEVLSEEWIEEHSNGPSRSQYVWVDDLKGLLAPKQGITEEQAWSKIAEYYPADQVGLKNAFEHFYYGGFMTDVVAKKPTIPEFVAEFLDGKEEYTLYELFDNDFIYDNHDELARWLYDNDEDTNKERELSLVLAQRYGYEVEVEQKYYVMNNDNRMMLVRMMDGKTITESDPFMLEDMYEGEKESHRLTEQEIKDYDPRYWAFAKPVEELE